MNKDTRLSGVLHVLLHLDRATVPLTSEVLASTMGTNPAVFRRTMAGLRNAGHVRSDKGHGGGWTLAKPLVELTLLDVYTALDQPKFFAIGNRNLESGCKIESAVNEALSDTLTEAQALLVKRFGEISLDQIAKKSSWPISAHCS